jgi:hypothetical protein
VSLIYSILSPVLSRFRLLSLFIGLKQLFILSIFVQIGTNHFNSFEPFETLHRSNDYGLDRNPLFSHSFFRNGHSLPTKDDFAEADEILHGHLLGENVAKLRLGIDW